MISIKGAKENNLKNISLEIPRNKITAVVGVSGSGKILYVFDEPTTGLHPRDVVLIMKGLKRNGHTLVVC